MFRSVAEISAYDEIIFGLLSAIVLVCWFGIDHFADTIEFARVISDLDVEFTMIRFLFGFMFLGSVVWIAFGADTMSYIYDIIVLIVCTMHIIMFYVFGILLAGYFFGFVHALNVSIFFILVNISLFGFFYVMGVLTDVAEEFMDASCLAVVLWPFCKPLALNLVIIFLLLTVSLKILKCWFCFEFGIGMCGQVWCFVTSEETIPPAFGNFILCYEFALGCATTYPTLVSLYKDDLQLLFNDVNYLSFVILLPFYLLDVSPY